MPVVSSTAVFAIEAQDLVAVSKSPYVHRNGKRLRRIRKTSCFRQVVIKHPSKKVVFLVYASGRCVVLGCRTQAEIEDSVAWLSHVQNSKLLKEPVVSNLVYAYEIDFRKRGFTSRLLPRLYKLFVQSKTGACIYEPEISPALILNPSFSPKTTVMLFSTGKITVTGCRTLAQIDETKGVIDRVTCSTE